MKKVSTIIMALAVIMGMTQCTKPAMQLYDGTYTGVTKEITFTTGGNSKVEIENVLNELKFKWQTGDTLYVYGSENGTFSDGQYCGKLGIVKGMGTENGFFSGTLNNVPETGKLRFYYCPNVLFDKEHKTITVDLSDQDGSLEDVASHLVACADVAVKPDGGDYSATLAVPYAVVKFDLSAFGTTAVTMTGTTNKGLTVSAKGVKDVTKGGSTTLSGTAVSSATCYVSIMPENVTTLGFSGGGKVGEKNVTLTENKFETIDDAGGSVPVPAEPVETDEWINFNDPAMGVTGLPIWAKYNLGANVDRILNDFENAVATDWYGGYYAWGEVEPYYTSINWTSATEGTVAGWKTGKTAGYDWPSYQWCNGSENTLTKYNTSSSYGTVDNKTILEAEDDAATDNLGGDWHTPTADEWKQLIGNTYSVGVSNYRGIEGLHGLVVYKVKSKTDKGRGGFRAPSGESYTTSDPHIFIPHAGLIDGMELTGGGVFCFYWLNSSDRASADKWLYYSCGQWYDNGWRKSGLSVRPVR